MSHYLVTMDLDTSFGYSSHLREFAAAGISLIFSQIGCMMGHAPFAAAGCKPACFVCVVISMPIFHENHPKQFTYAESLRLFIKTR